MISSSSPRPRHFISRNDGTITPLIAVDELPTGVRIVDVPSTLSHEDTQGMISLGVQPRSQGRYVVETPESPIQNSSDQPPSCDSPTSKKPIDVSVATSKANNGAKSDQSVENWRQGVDVAQKTQAKIEEIIAASGGSKTPARPRQSHLYNPRTPGIYGKKEYCTHFLRTGQCDYIQQGCMYKHDVPDPTTLRSLGFREIPRFLQKGKGGGVPPAGLQERPPVTQRPWRSQSVVNRPTGPTSMETPTRTPQNSAQYGADPMVFLPNSLMQNWIPPPNNFSSSPADIPYQQPQPGSWIPPSKMSHFSTPTLPPAFPTSAPRLRSTHHETQHSPQFRSSPLSSYQPLMPSQPSRFAPGNPTSPFPQPTPSLNPNESSTAAFPASAPVVHRRRFIPPDDAHTSRASRAAETDKAGAQKEATGFDSPMKRKATSQGAKEMPSEESQLVDVKGGGS